MNIRDEFFVIDSRNLDAVTESRMYGFAIDETGVFENDNYKKHSGIMRTSCWSPICVACHIRRLVLMR